MQTRCRNEIDQLHAFFQGWFNGELPATADSFARFAGVLAEPFTLIAPTGVHAEREQVLAGLRQSHASRSDIRIWIENVRLQHHSGDIIIATYEEWQQTGDTTTARLSTVVFREKSGNPNGLEWLHMHETWLPQQKPE